MHTYICISVEDIYIYIHIRYILPRCTYTDRHTYDDIYIYRCIFQYSVHIFGALHFDTLIFNSNGTAPKVPCWALALNGFKRYMPWSRCEEVNRTRTDEWDERSHDNTHIFRYRYITYTYIDWYTWKFFNHFFKICHLGFNKEDLEVFLAKMLEGDDHFKPVLEGLLGCLKVGLIG